MKSLTYMTGLMLALMLVASTAMAEMPSNAIRTMATMTFYLNHFPADADKGKLRDIANSSGSPEYEKTIASAMLNLHHKAIASDKKKLIDVINDKSVPKAARDLAKIIHDLNHKPSSADKKVLKQYMW